MRILILGGTTEANALARDLAHRRDLAPVLSLAGRTAAPALPPIPCRIGGFGGAEGLARYLARETVEVVVDATHPFAARMSAHAADACAATGVPLARLSRPPWHPEAGDTWTSVSDLAAAADALGVAPRRVLLTTGRLGLAAFRAAPQHSYVIRTIDPPAPADLPPQAVLVFDRGPFRLDAETALMRRERIDVLVTKNSGGTAARAKLDAARGLALPVIVVERPPVGRQVEIVATTGEAVAWIDAHRAVSP